ncbi:MAG: hypothetical protein QXR09_02505 [Candidatus Aenigmatarchaeota archaeon]
MDLAKKGYFVKIVLEVSLKVKQKKLCLRRVYMNLISSSTTNLNFITR